MECDLELASVGLEPPRVRVTVRDEAGGELGWLELGDPQPRQGMAARSSAGEQLWRGRNDVGEDVPLGLEAFRNNWIKREPEATAAESDE